MKITMRVFDYDGARSKSRLPKGLPKDLYAGETYDAPDDWGANLVKAGKASAADAPLPSADAGAPAGDAEPSGAEDGLFCEEPECGKPYKTAAALKAHMTRAGHGAKEEYDG